jgi:hypothetical protein
MKRVRIDLSVLMEAFDNCRIGNRYFLDTETGEILQISDQWTEAEEIEAIEEKIEREPDRFLDIPDEGSREGYQDMQSFTATIEDDNLREKLQVALDGRGAFRRFRNVLYNYPEKRKDWFSFKDERLKHRVTEWLEENDIEPEFIEWGGK